MASYWFFEMIGGCGSWFGCAHHDVTWIVGLPCEAEVCLKNYPKLPKSSQMKMRDWFLSFAFQVERQIAAQPSDSPKGENRYAFKCKQPGRRRGFF